MKYEKEIIKQIKSLQNQSPQELHEKLGTFVYGEIYSGLQNASSGMSKSINKREEEIEMSKKLKYKLISSEEYQKWEEKQKKIDAMNEETRKEERKRNENFKEKSDIMCLAFHISYMTNAYSNPSLNTKQFFTHLDWNKFNEMLIKYEIEKEPYINKIINEFKLKETKAIQTDSIIKIGIGALIIILWFSFFGC